MKRTLVFLMVLVLLLSMSAAALAENPLALEPFPETVTVNVMRENNPNMWYPEGESMEKNVLIDFYLEKLNIQYNVKWLIDPGYGGEQLDLAIASNELPDMFEASPAQVYRLARAGQIQPLGDVYDQYVSDNVRAALNLNDNMFFNQVTVDGEMYAIPEPNDFADSVPLLYIRKDWMDHLGLEQPTTMEDIENIALAFMTQDVDGTGHSADYGVRLDNSLGMPLYGISHAFDGYFNIWIPDGNGGLMFSDIQPEAKAYLTLMNDWYNKGIFDPEFAIKTDSKTAEEVGAGNVGIVYGRFWTMFWPLFLTMQNDPNCEWVCYPIIARTDGTYEVSALNSARYLVVRTGYEYPEAAVLGANLWYELWQGQYAEYYHGMNLNEYAEAGEDLKFYIPFWFDPPVKNMIQAKNVWDRFPDAAKRDEIVSPETRKQWDKMMDYYNGNKSNIVGWEHIIMFMEAFKNIEDYYGGENALLYDGYTGPVTSSIARRLPLINQLRDEAFIAFIMGDKSFDEWDSFVAEWYAVGGEDMTKDVNDWYQTKNQ